MRVWLLAALCVYCSAQNGGVRRCSWTEAYGMKGFQCTHMDLREVPNHLSTSIELLDLSTNRIRALTATSLSRYTYLRYLYFNDNLIQSVDEDAFSALQLLEVVDLSLNGLHQVPPSLLRLPLLRRLYVAENALGEGAGTSLDDYPPAPELHFLSLAQCGLNSLPPLHGFKKLHTLNVSGNSLTNLTVGHIAPLCRLAVLDLTGNGALLSQPEQRCDCVRLAKWLAAKGVKLARGYHLKCSGEPPQECLDDAQMSSEELEYESCRRELVVREQTARTRKAWSTAGICVGVVVGVALVALLVWLRCRRRRRRVTQNAHNHNAKPLLLQPPADAPKAANGEPAGSLEERPNAALS